MHKGREVLSQVKITAGFVKILTGFIKTATGFDKISAEFILFPEF